MWQTTPWGKWLSSRKKQHFSWRSQELFLTHCVMEKLLSLSAETQILLPDFRGWPPKDVVYRGNVFPDPTDRRWRLTATASVLSWRLDQRLLLKRLRVALLLAQPSAHTECMAAPSWFLLCSSSNIVQRTSKKKLWNKSAMIKNIFIW